MYLSTWWNKLSDSFYSTQLSQLWRKLWAFEDLLSHFTFVCRFTVSNHVIIMTLYVSCHMTGETLYKGLICPIQVPASLGEPALDQVPGMYVMLPRCEVPHLVARYLSSPRCEVPVVTSLRGTYLGVRHPWCSCCDVTSSRGTYLNASHPCCPCCDVWWHPT
jgi:hypothetical protein